METNQVNEIDFVKKNMEFLVNSNTFMFDVNDEDEIKLASYDITAREVLFVAWLHSIWYDVVRVNKSLLVGVGGRHRSGKSLWATTMAYMLDPTFWERRDKRIVHTPSQFMNELEYVRENHIRGAVFVVDEGGVVTPSDAYYEDWYKQLNKSFQIMGYINPIVFFCAVIRDNIGAKFRKLFNIQVKCIRYDNKFSKLKIYDLNYDDLKGKTMPRRVHARIFGRKYIMRGARFGKPPDFIVSGYEELTVPEKDRLLAKIAKDMKQNESEDNVKQKKKDEESLTISAIEDVMGNPYKYSTPSSNLKKVVIDQHKIREEKGLTFRASEQVKREVERRLKEQKIQQKPDAKFIKDEAERTINAKGGNKNG